MKSRVGVSMVEITIALFVAALAIGPMIALLSSSNRMSTASTYETLAVYYATEISDQIRRLAPQLPDILEDARVKTGVSNLEMPSIFSWDPDELLFYDNAKTVFFKAAGMNLDARLILTPLHRNFLRRTIDVQQLDNSALQEFDAESYYKVIITIEWEDDLTQGNVSKELKMVVIIND